jgi:hypothetical protein
LQSDTALEFFGGKGGEACEVDCEEKVCIDLGLPCGSGEGEEVFEF